MKLKYNLTEEDYINFNIAHMKNSKSLKRTMMINRFLTPLIFLVMPFVLDEISNISFWYWAVIFVLTYILWVVLYEKNVYKINIKRIRKMLEEKRNESLIGERILEIDGENIRIINDRGENIIYIKSIKNIIENDEYIFIYINSISAIIIPIKVFKSVEDKELFKSLLN
ncbi:YcxB family protein [Clostridium tertium]|uniref:YcxB family protein n=1 Tax=Clostridium tertium TaxID=1559 RepID=UPI00232D725A|nr:YcxB family protein [Clostridium tertium]MDB1934052.1 YcxB family protein [Clostridium tertium]MDB1937073.1 YcxB family protein [Clostridium tertium]